MTDADGTTLLFMMNCDSSNGEGGRAIQTTFPAGSYLYQYATGQADSGDTMSNFYYTVPSNQQVSDLVIPKGGYFAFSWRTPEQPSVNVSTPRHHHPAKRRGCLHAHLRPHGWPRRRPGLQSLRRSPTPTRPTTPIPTPCRA